MEKKLLMQMLILFWIGLSELNSQITLTYPDDFNSSILESIQDSSDIFISIESKHSLIDLTVFPNLSRLALSAAVPLELEKIQVNKNLESLFLSSGSSQENILDFLNKFERIEELQIDDEIEANSIFFLETLKKLKTSKLALSNTILSKNIYSSSNFNIELESLELLSISIECNSFEKLLDVYLAGKNLSKLHLEFQGKWSKSKVRNVCSSVPKKLNQLHLSNNKFKKCDLTQLNELDLLIIEGASFKGKSCNIILPNDLSSLVLVRTKFGSKNSFESKSNNKIEDVCFLNQKFSTSSSQENFKGEFPNANFLYEEINLSAVFHEIQTFEVVSDILKIR